MVTAYVTEAMLKRASDKGLASFAVRNVREYSLDKHHKVDERPYGGGPGMVMTAEPFLRAYDSLGIPTTSTGAPTAKTKVIMLSPGGKLFTNDIARTMAKKYHDIVFICGRYEGVDDRVRQILDAEEYSVGDYVLTGGELPALTMADAIVRQIPGVLGDYESLEEERVASPHVYTRPEIVQWQRKVIAGTVKKSVAKKAVKKPKTYTVPEVLVQGDHKKILAWRASQLGE